MPKKYRLAGNGTEQHFDIGQVIQQLAAEAGRVIVSVSYDPCASPESAVRRAAHDIACDWHDLNEGGDVTDLILDLAQPGVLLCILVRRPSEPDVAR